MKRTRLRVVSTAAATIALIGALIAVFWGAVPSNFWVSLLGASIAFAGGVVAHGVYRRTKQIAREAEETYQRALREHGGTP